MSAAAAAPAPARRRPQSEGQPFIIRSANGDPIEIPAGEFYFNPKARCRGIMARPLSPLAQQVDACLELATMGFQQEDAVIMEKGQKRYLTTTDIGRQIGQSEQNARKGLAEIECAGRAARRSDDGGPLRKGHVIISAWATPREPKEADSARARLESILHCPEEWAIVQSTFKRLRLNFALTESIARDYKDRINEVARTLKDGEKLVRALAEDIGAQPPKTRAIKVKEPKDSFEKKPSPSSSSSSLDQQHPTPTPTSSPVQNPNPPEKQNPPREEPKAPDERHQVAAALKAYGNPDPAAVDQLIRDCRTYAPDAAAFEIVYWIHAKAPLARSSPIGFLLRSVPLMFSAGADRERAPEPVAGEPVRPPTRKLTESDQHFVRELKKIIQDPTQPQDEINRAEALLRRILYGDS